MQLSTFIRACEREGLSRSEVATIVDMIAMDPEAGVAIAGTGGCRKVQVAKPGGGKSGGYHLITFFSGPRIPAFLITIYGKGAKDNLSKAERNALATLSAELVEHYKARHDDEA